MTTKEKCRHTYHNNIIVIPIHERLDKSSEASLPRFLQLLQTPDLPNEAILRRPQLLLRRHDLDGNRCATASPLADVHAARAAGADHLVKLVVHELLREFVRSRRDTRR